MVWGLDASKWIDLHCTIWCDQKVRFGKAEVGGIRVSHMEGLTQPRTLSLATARNARGNFVAQPLKIPPNSEKKVGQYRSRLLEVAEDPEKSVDEAWSKVSEEMKTELGDGLYDQLIAFEKAAQEHCESDPMAAVDALNESIGGE